MDNRVTRAAALVIAATVSAGCTPTATPLAPPATGASVHSIEVDGQTRTFRVFRPRKPPPSVPLVVVLHGWGFTAEQIEKDYGWNDLAAKRKFVVVHPEGIGLSWNAAGDCCGPAADNEVDDIAFIAELVKYLQRTLSLDAERTYAAGMSNGGVLAYALACRTTLFAAISSVAGTQVGGCEIPRPTSVLQVHGLDDDIVRFDGGPAVVPDAQPVPRVVDYWRRITTCQPPQRSRRGPVLTEKADCAGGREVTLVTITGEGHTWPGRAGSTAPWDATTEVWRFFSRHP